MTAVILWILVQGFSFLFTDYEQKWKRKWNCHGSRLNNLGLLCHITVAQACLQTHRHMHIMGSANRFFFFFEVLQPELETDSKGDYFPKYPVNRKTGNRGVVFRFSPQSSSQIFLKMSQIGQERLSAATFECFERFSARLKPELQLGLWSRSSVRLCAHCHPPAGRDIVHSFQGFMAPRWPPFPETSVPSFPFTCTNDLKQCLQRLVTRIQLFYFHMTNIWFFFIINKKER